MEQGTGKLITIGNLSMTRIITRCALVNLLSSVSLIASSKQVLTPEFQPSSTINYWARTGKGFACNKNVQGKDCRE